MIGELGRRVGSVAFTRSADETGSVETSEKMNSSDSRDSMGGAGMVELGCGGLDFGEGEELRGFDASCDSGCACDLELD